MTATTAPPALKRFRSIRRPTPVEVGQTEDQDMVAVCARPLPSMPDVLANFRLAMDLERQQTELEAMLRPFKLAFTAAPTVPTTHDTAKPKDQKPQKPQKLHAPAVPPAVVQLAKRWAEVAGPMKLTAHKPWFHGRVTVDTACHWPALSRTRVTAERERLDHEDTYQQVLRLSEAASPRKTTPMTAKTSPWAVVATKPPRPRRVSKQALTTGPSHAVPARVAHCHMVRSR